MCVVIRQQPWAVFPALAAKCFSITQSLLRRVDQHSTGIDQLTAKMSRTAQANDGGNRCWLVSWSKCISATLVTWRQLSAPSEREQECVQRCFRKCITVIASLRNNTDHEYMCNESVPQIRRGGTLSFIGCVCVCGRQVSSGPAAYSSRPPPPPLPPPPPPHWTKPRLNWTNHCQSPLP